MSVKKRRWKCVDTDVFQLINPQRTRASFWNHQQNLEMHQRDFSFSKMSPDYFSISLQKLRSKDLKQSSRGNELLDFWLQFPVMHQIIIVMETRNFILKTSNNEELVLNVVIASVKRLITFNYILWCWLVEAVYIL